MTEEENQPDDGEVVVSADLQKVIMIPRIQGSKAALFTRRLIAFNETFANVNEHLSKNHNNFVVIWHEAISGRKGSDIASTFWYFLLANRDAKKIIIWLDNCAGQNKNWILYSMLVKAVNSRLTSVGSDHLEIPRDWSHVLDGRQYSCSD